MKRPRTGVSDHAVIRYLERVQGFDIDAVRSEMGRIVELAHDFPGASSVLSNGFRYVLRDGVIVTVLPTHMPVDPNHEAKS